MVNKMKIGKLLLSYDEYEATENEAIFQLELAQNDGEKDINIDIIRDRLSQGQYGFDYLNFYADDVIKSLTEIIEQKFSKNNYWVFARVKNFGWNNSDGQKVCQLQNGIDVINKILPQTDCTFKIFNFGKGIAIQNWHHDSPIGNEWYYILPASKKTLKQEGIR